jgi:hypothetical protein
LFLAAMGLATQAAAQPCGDNACTTIVLHAVNAVPGPCDTGVDCQEGGTLPTLNVSGMATPSIVMLVANYDRCQGVQCAFEWDPSWVFTFGLWDCQPNQLSAVTPTASGETAGTISTAFDEITLGAVAPVGRLGFGASPASGCISIIDSSFPDATHVVGNFGEGIVPQPVIEDNRGRVCVGGVAAGAYDACIPVVAVEPTTWGSIKAQYSR